MEIIIQSTIEAAASVAARLTTRLLLEKPDTVLGVATGSKPLFLYLEIFALKLDWRTVTTFDLDEHVGLAATHPQSYHSFMWENLFRHTNIAKKELRSSDGRTKDIPKFSGTYEKPLRAEGVINLQVLGIGRDGPAGKCAPAAQSSAGWTEPEPKRPVAAFVRPSPEGNRQIATCQQHDRPQPYCKHLTVTLH